MARAILEVRDLWVGHDPGVAVLGVSFQVGPGRVLAVRGAAGTGKSRLLQCVGLDQQPERGTVLLRGEDLTRALPERRRAVRAGGWIELVHPPVDSAAAAPAMRPRTPGVLPSRTRVTVPMAAMRQRMQLAKALTNRTEVLLLDEPLAGVDAAVQRRIVELLYRLRTDVGTAVVIATRDDEQSLGLADELLDLDGAAEARRPVRLRPGAAEGTGRRFSAPWKDRRPRRSA